MHTYVYMRRCRGRYAGRKRKNYNDRKYLRTKAWTTREEENQEDFKSSFDEEINSRIVVKGERFENWHESSILTIATSASFYRYDI